jgi:hypothetical protein
MKSPCYRCLIVPACRSKGYGTLLNNCELLFDFLLGGPEFGYLAHYVEDDLNPISWYVYVDGKDKRVSIVDRVSDVVIAGYYFGDNVNVLPKEL